MDLSNVDVSFCSVYISFFFYEVSIYCFGSWKKLELILALVGPSPIRGNGPWRNERECVAFAGPVCDVSVTWMHRATAPLKLASHPCQTKQERQVTEGDIQ